MYSGRVDSNLCPCQGVWGHKGRWGSGCNANLASFSCASYNIIRMLRYSLILVSGSLIRLISVPVWQMFDQHPYWHLPVFQIHFLKWLLSPIQVLLMICVVKKNILKVQNKIFQVQNKILQVRHVTESDCSAGFGIGSIK